MRAPQVNFSRGEIGEHLRARFDVDAYQAALERARNVVVMKYGGITKRPGTFLVAEVTDPSRDVRLVPFQFSVDQTYALEFGHGYMVPHALGGRVLETELAITGITNASQAQITAAYHGYSVGDPVYISGVDGELGDFLNGRFFTVQSVVSANAFTIDADTSGLAAFASATGGSTRTEAPGPDPEAPEVTSPPPAPPPPPVGGGGGGRFRYESQYEVEQ